MSAERQAESDVLDGGNLDLDFIDFPTGWAIQRKGLTHTDERCSAVQTGGAMLCDCDALPIEWARLKAAHRGTDQDEPITYGMCLACRSIEVALNKPIGTRDFSDIGESATYPVGYGCEVCA